MCIKQFGLDQESGKNKFYNQNMLNFLPAVYYASDFEKIGGIYCFWLHYSLLCLL